MNKQSIEINCNCYGGVAGSDKYFLTRTKNHQENELQPASHRRQYKSIEKKYESEGKGHKKSLKKRPNSYNHNHQSSNVEHNQTSKHETEPRLSFQQQIHTKSKSQWVRSVETPLPVQPPPLAPFIQFKYPETTTGGRPPQLYGSHRELETVPASSGPQIGQIPYIPKKVHFEHPNTPLRPQLQQFQVQTVQPISKQESRQSFRQDMVSEASIRRENMLRPPLSIEKGIRPEASKDSLINEVSSPGYLRSHQIERGDRMLTESWAHHQDDLMIEGFDKLFLKQEENLTQSNLPSSKRNHPRQTQKSKRLQNQLLIGRFAQSDGEDSDSPPSEVIGRGFDKTYQDLLPEEFEVGGLVSETKASRSTNTRVSDMKNMNRRMSAFNDVNFSNFPSAQYKTYKFL